jgi:CDGSH-type Zn-finger protein
MSTKITPTPNGPLKVEGGVTLASSDGKETEHPETVFLCRCGHSSKKPFCDGSHKANSFTAA